MMTKLPDVYQSVEKGSKMLQSSPNTTLLLFLISDKLNLKVKYIGLRRVS